MGLIIIISPAFKFQELRIFRRTDDVVGVSYVTRCRDAGMGRPSKGDRFYMEYTLEI